MKLKLFALVFLIVNIDIRLISGEQCEARYLRMSSQHTMCKYANPSCRIFQKGITDADKELILRLHNEYRSRVATGNETYGDGFPPAADMLEITWDDELAIEAQKHAETCLNSHDCNECRGLEHFPVGQNIGNKWMSSTVLEENKDWRWFLKMLYDEVINFHTNLIGSYVIRTQANYQYGHFSQIIWSRTWRIGCGWVLYQSGYYNTSYYVCNYGPGGNVEHERVYKEGEICSACPKNSCCNEACQLFNIIPQYPGLCKVINETLPPRGFGSQDPKNFFYCDFYGEPDCERIVRGKQTWEFVETIGGNWISLFLNEGETAEILMNTAFQSPSHVFCFQMFIRSGAVQDGQPFGINTAITFLDSSGKLAKFTLKGSELRQQFIRYSMDVSLSAKTDITVSITFTGEAGVPSQFLEIKEISAKEDPCGKTK